MVGRLKVHGGLGVQGSILLATAIPNAILTHGRDAGVRHNKALEPLPQAL
jgi:hypothetical protein